MAEGNEAPTTEPETPTEAPKRGLSLLARETFGANYTGEVKEAEDAPPEPNESPEDAPEEPPEEEVEASEESAEESPEGESAPEGEDEGETISSVTELIESQEYDPEWFNNLKVPVKVNGEPAEATFQDLVASYQMKEAAEKRLEEAKSKAKSFTEEIAEKSAALEGQYATAAKLIERAEGLLDDDVANINWSDLRENDPAEYAARKADIEERRERIAQMKREAVEEYQKGQQERQKESQAQLQERLQAESQALLEKLPEWRDEKKAEAGKAKLAKYLIGQGFTEQDVMGASDHRLILLAEKARLYDEGQGRTETAKKRVAKVPKVIKPGAPKPKQEIEQEKVKKLQARLRKTGSMEDAFALLKTRRK